MFRIGQEEIDEVAKVIRGGQLMRIGDPSQGHLQMCANFEAEFSEKVGSEYSLLMCGGGTAALVCLLAALGIGPGDEVIVPAYTWLASATSALTVGAIPVLAEVDETMSLDPDDFERKIGPNTKAVVPVHMVGRPANMPRIMEIARKNGIKVVEDACQGLGSSVNGKLTGTWGDAGAFSFNWYKIITSGGEGGAMVTNDRATYERAFVFHDTGSTFRPTAGELTVPLFIAQQYRADEVMAAIARVQLGRLDGILRDLRRNKTRVERELASAGLTIAPSNDSDGECGVVATLRFSDPAEARSFSEKCGCGYLGIDHGKHIFTQWEPVIAKRVMHHPSMNPFNFEANKGLRADYSETACPRTLDLLRRTYFVSINPDWTEADIVACIDSCKRAAGKA